ncbi:hypothetical protein HanRHA438_Chr01g0016841 [Helianthus annuus]|nr:hypothetical protein HanIR_Chr01g0018241 [Helianthus annuus]KAJ0947585.1 hypothetical protein HanRHA438_Chr01g0016841 [Helianthus annuus]
MLSLLLFELAYAHLYEIIGSDIIKFGLTAIYLFANQYFTQIGGKVSVKLIKREKNESSEYRANSLIYKGLTLMPFRRCNGCRRLHTCQQSTPSACFHWFFELSAYQVFLM